MPLFACLYYPNRPPEVPTGASTLEFRGPTRASRTSSTWIVRFSPGAVLCGGEKNRSWVETSIRMGGVRPGDDVQIRVTRETLPTCSIRGRVLDPDGSAPKHSMVWLRIPGEGHGLELEDGFFKTSEHLAPGTYFLTCQERNYPEWYLGEFTLAPNQSLDLGSLRRPQPGTLLVQMTAKQREYMVLHPNGEYSQAGVSNEELSLFPGRHFVQYGHAYFAVTIESGQQTTLDLRTLELAENRFELRASEPGRVLGGVDVVVRDSAGLLAARTQVASSNSRPNVVLALRHGHYRMHLRSETGLTAVHDFHAGESQALVRIEMFRR